jgi:hypothetical protein
MTQTKFETKDRFFAHEPLVERAVVGAQTNLCAGAAQDGAEAKRHFRRPSTRSCGLSCSGSVPRCADYGRRLESGIRENESRLAQKLRQACASKAPPGRFPLPAAYY